MQKVLSWLTGPAVFDDVALRPSLVLMAGFAGGLQENQRVGDVILATEVVDESGGRWPTTWPGELPAGKWSPPLVRGRILTAGRIIARSEDKLRLGKEHQALAVDMESALVARCCQSADIPFGCVRCISDEADTELSTRLSALFSRNDVSLVRLAAAVLRSPGMIRELGQLARNTRIAAKQLGKALGELLTLTTPYGD